MKLTHQPRIRMFAGPNGSGKSRLKSILKPELLGVYVNPDDIEAVIKKTGFLNFKEFEIVVKQDEITAYFAGSDLLKRAELLGEVKKIVLIGQKLDFSRVAINSYFASVIADFIRNKLIENLQSFSFETVMSSPDKIEILKKAKKLGYKTYLYFIATESPEINISRVKYRVSLGGHDVPKDKIISRYYKSLNLLIEAIKNSWRAYIFDNSGGEEFLLAEVENGKIIEVKVDSVPAWFARDVINKINN